MHFHVSLVTCKLHVTEDYIFYADLGNRIQLSRLVSLLDSRNHLPDEKIFKLS